MAVVGATGAVGREMVALLEAREFPLTELRLLASKRSVGQKLRFRDDLVSVEEATHESFADVDVVLMSAGAGVALELAPIAAAAGAVVVDNSSAFRRYPDVPLVVPECNPHAVDHRPRGIIANPNCSTIQMVVALAPLHREAKIQRIIASTYQSVSGAGQKGMEELRRGCADMLEDREPGAEVFPHPIALDCLPHIANFEDDGYTTEEHKMVFETHKILEDSSIRVTATCVRVPVMRGHAEAVLIETETPLAPESARELLRNAPGIVVVDEPDQIRYPLARQAAGEDPVYVGRIRRDSSSENGLWLWIVADNLRKGAALNTVQIAEQLRAR